MLLHLAAALEETAVHDEVTHHVDYAAAHAPAPVDTALPCTAHQKSRCPYQAQAPSASAS